MRASLSLLCMLVFLALASPAQAQLRADATPPSPVAVYDTGSENDASGGFGAALSDWVGTAFSDEHFRMSHSYEMSMSSFGGGSSLGMYTNSMQWQFNDAWAARVDMSVAHQPFGGNGFGSGFGEDGQNMRVFLRNAEVAYRPNENMTFHFQVRQSPYGRYAGPFGAPALGRRAAFGAPMAFGHRGAFAGPPARGGLFWKNEQRN